MMNCKEKNKTKTMNYKIRESQGCLIGKINYMHSTTMKI